MGDRDSGRDETTQRRSRAGNSNGGEFISRSIGLSGGAVIAHAGIKAQREKIVISGSSLVRVCPRLRRRAAVFGRREGAALTRRADMFGSFHGGKSFGHFPSGAISPRAKKSPSGVAPEGSKSLVRSEPSRHACGGDDGYNNGGQAKSGEGCSCVVVHLKFKKKGDEEDGVETFFPDARSEVNRGRMPTSTNMRVRKLAADEGATGSWRPRRKTDAIGRREVAIKRLIRLQKIGGNFRMRLYSGRYRFHVPTPP